MDDKLTEVKMVIKALLITAQHGMDMATLNNEYFDQEGTNIPFQQFGFSNLNEFLLSINDTVYFDSNRAGERVLFPVTDESTAHIRKFVENQKPQPVKRRPTSGQADYGKRCRPGPSYGPLTNSQNRMAQPPSVRRPPEHFPPPRQPFIDDSSSTNDRRSASPGAQSYEVILCTMI